MLKAYIFKREVSPDLNGLFTNMEVQNLLEVKSIYL